MKYVIEDGREVFYNIDDVLDYCIDEDYHEDDDYFVDWINECYSGVTIAGVEFEAYDILENCDPHLLGEIRSQYCEERNDEDRDEGRHELLRANDGDDVYVQGWYVHVIDDEEEKDEEEAHMTIDSLREKIESEKQKFDEEEQDAEDGIMGLLQIVGG